MTNRRDFLQGALYALVAAAVALVLLLPPLMAARSHEGAESVLRRLPDGAALARFLDPADEGDVVAISVEFHTPWGRAYPWHPDLPPGVLTLAPGTNRLAASGATQAP